jgi:uncharacterized protein YggU (UPF0235/DUF167 family)
VRITARAGEEAANRALIQVVAKALVCSGPPSAWWRASDRAKSVEVIGLDPASLNRLREP